MSALVPPLLWCIVQVTLVALLAWLLCAFTRRLSPQSASPLPATALLAVIGLTALAFVPWPSTWSYGPAWNVANDSQPSSAANNAVPKMEPRPTPARDESLPAAPHRAMDVPASNPLTTIGDVAPEVNVAPQGESATAEPPTTTVPALRTPQASSPAAASAASNLGNWQLLLLGILAAGAAIGLLQLLGGLAAAQAYRRKSCAIDDAALRELADVLCAQLGCTRPVELRESSALASAATIGWRRPLILLPLEWRDWTSEQLRAVLAHEIAHVSRHDFLACVLAQASLALHFYHPLVHWLVRRLRLEQEVAADAAAAAIAGGRQVYLQILAELALRQSERPLGWPARTFLPTRGTFMRRIEMLRDAKNGPAEKSRWLTWPRRVAVLLLIIGAAAVAGLRGGAPPAEVAQAQDKPKVVDEPKAGEQPKEAQPDSGEISVAQVPSDCLAFAAIRIQPLLKNPETAEVLRKLDLRTAESRAALPLEKLAQISMVLSVRGGEGIRQSEPLVIVETTAPADFAKALILEGGPQTDIEEVKEADLQKEAEGPAFVHTRLGDNAAVFGPRRDIARYLTRKRGGAPLVRGDGWKQVSQQPVVFAVDMMAVRRMIPPGDGPEELLNRTGMTVFWSETESIVIGVSLGKKADIRMVTECLGEKGATQVEQMAENGAVALRNIFREMRTASLKHAADNIGARMVEEPEFVQLLHDAADKALSNVKVDRQGTLITANATVDLKGRVGALSALVPSVASMRANGRRAQSANNIRQIMIAMHNYADTYGGRFPPAVIYGKDGKGKVPHSWRVELLPYLEQEALYRAYQFDEPWDSEANKKVLAQMPAVFRDPSADPKSTSSAYYVMVGKAKEVKKGEEGGGAAAPPGGGLGAAGGAAPPAGAPPAGAPGATPLADAPPGGGVVVDTSLPTAFSKKDGIRFAEMLDGTSNTIAVVEATRDIPWTKPEDIPYDPKGKAPKLGGFYDDGFHVGICDGSVRFLPGNIKADSLRAYLSPAGGEPIAPPQPNPGLELRATPVETPKPRGR